MKKKWKMLSFMKNDWVQGLLRKKNWAIYLWTTDKASGVSQVPRSIQSSSLHFGIFLSNTGFDHSSFFQDSCHNKSVSLAQVLPKNQRNTSLISKRRQQMCDHQAIKNVWLSPNRLELDRRVDALNQTAWLQSVPQVFIPLLLRITEHRHHHSFVSQCIRYL